MYNYLSDSTCFLSIHISNLILCVVTFKKCTLKGKLIKDENKVSITNIILIKMINKNVSISRGPVT